MEGVGTDSTLSCGPHHLFLIFPEPVDFPRHIRFGFLNDLAAPRGARLPPQRWDERTISREQHLLKQEHPPCTERISLTKECGWKDGDRGGLAEWELIHGKKKMKVCLDVNRPSHGRT